MLVVVGSQRSGTTLTAQILGGSTNTFLIDEKDGVYGWFDAVVADTDDLDSVTDVVIGRAASKYQALHGRVVRGGLSDSIDTVVLKAPNLTFASEAMAQLPWPVHLIYPVRDPRAVVASMGRLTSIDFVANQLRLIDKSSAATKSRLERMRAVMADSTRSPVERRAALWRAKSGERSTFEANGLSLHQFLYEDLVLKPASRKDLLSSCELTWSDTTGHENVFQGSGPGGTSRSRSLDDASLSLWRSELSAADQRSIMTIAGSLAKSFAYD